MATVKINNKNYEVPKLNFGHMEMLESEGYNIVDMFKRNQIFAPVSAFIMLCVGCDKEDANILAEQHVLGGGDLKDIFDKFSEALFESSFFRKVLGIEDEKKATKSTKKSTETKTEE